jgi:oxalate decarboxylase/phosphoglucose isomerase-like protein (cupin superfamily)
MNKISGKRFVSPEDVETQVFPWGRLQWLSEPRITGTSKLATGVVTLTVGKGHDRHNHEDCEEVIYFVKGEGQQTVEVEGNLQMRFLREGDLIHVPPSAYHSTLNTGTVPLVLLVVYEVAGAEAMLRSLPECRIEPPKRAG